MKKAVFAFLIFCSCTRGGNFALWQGSSSSKQKQKIVYLQKKLHLAEKEQKKVEGEVERISKEIAKVQLSLIRKQIDDYEKSDRKEPHLFLEERELLYQIIQGGPSPCAFEAQIELDRILRIITEVSDRGKSENT